METATHSSLALPLLVGAIFWLAGLVKGVVGLGLPTVAVALLSLLMTPLEAAALLLLPSLATNVWQLLAGPAFRQLARRLRGLLAGIVPGTLLGTWLLPDLGPGFAVRALGLALLLYALLGLAALRLQVPARLEARLSPLAGALTGLFTAATGVFVIPAVPYLQGLGLEKEELVQALGLSFTVSTLALGLGLFLGGALRPGIAGASLLALAPALLGMACGQVLRKRMPAATFRQCFFAGLLLLGLHLLLG